MDVIRLRLKEVLEERGLTPYAFARDSKGKINLTTLYRIIRRGGHVRYLDTEFLDNVCALLKCGPADLLEVVPGKAKRRKRATAA